MFGELPNAQRNHRGRRTTVLLFIAGLFFGCGCAVWESDLVSDGTIRLEELPSVTARLSRVRVYEDGGDLAVYGKIGRRAGVKGRVEAMIRVILSYPDGRTLEETKRAFPPYLPIRRSRKSNFMVRFPGLPPAGAVVRIECPPIPASAPASSSPAVLFQDKEMPQ